MVMTDEDRTTLLGSIDASPRYRDDDTAEQDPPAPRDPRRTLIFGAVGAAIVVALFVLYWVLLGPSGAFNQVQIPDVANKPAPQAQEELQRAGFSVAIQQITDGKVASNNVIATQPLGGSRAPKGSTVTMQVSTGPQQIPVPRLAKLTQQQAEQQLNAFGLRLDPNIGHDASSADDKDKVVNQNPPEGAKVDSGSAVTISLGKGPDQTRVPQVVGQSIDVAEPNLQDSAGFKVVVQQVPSARPKGEVIGTSPAGGAMADKGSTVTVQVSAGGQISMPDLTGLTPAQAADKLRSAGWTGGAGQISQTTQGTFDTGNVGRIVDQQPKAGSSVGKNATVTIVMGVLGPP
jgi:serine/threonine-protein kinase